MGDRRGKREARTESKRWVLAAAGAWIVLAAWGIPIPSMGASAVLAMEGQRMAEGDGTIAARSAAQIASAADAAQASSRKSDAASLARMGALPASMIKWGQLKSPWKADQFMDIELKGSGPEALVAVVAPSIPNSLCSQSVVELAMSPELERVEVGSWSLEVGEPWKIKDMDELCRALEKGPVRMWAKRAKFVR